MKWTLKLVAEVVPGKPTEYEVATIERLEDFSPSTVGIAISEGKAVLAGLQKQIVTAQVEHHGAKAATSATTDSGGPKSANNSEPASG